MMKIEYKRNLVHNYLNFTKYIYLKIVFLKQNFSEK